MDKMRSWREVLADCADCLESEVEARWRLPDGSIHPAQQRKYEHDLEPVKEARALLAALPSCEGWRPMSEAPKEKMTSVLVAQVGKPPVRAFWYDDHWHLHGSTQRLEADLEPTHWMPLPSPPERKEK